MRWLAEPLLWRQVTRVYAQHPDEVAQWLAVGLDQTRVIPAGSLKYDTEGLAPVAPFDEWLRQHGCEPKAHRFLLGGSLHPGEEEMLLKVFVALRTRYPDLFLILVPRHVERTPEILQLLEAHPVRWTIRSEPRFEPDTAVLLVNSTGELRGWYETADLVVIGKSFCGAGGQNPVEPLQAARPVICGPYMEISRRWCGAWRPRAACANLVVRTSCRMRLPICWTIPITLRPWWSGPDRYWRFTVGPPRALRHPSSR